MRRIKSLEIVAAKFQNMQLQLSPHQPIPRNPGAQRSGTYQTACTLKICGAKSTVKMICNNVAFGFAFDIFS